MYPLIPMYVPIDVIDWARLAEQYNKMYQTTYSFEGSNIYILDVSEHEIKIYVELIVSSDKDNIKKAKPMTPRSNRFSLDRETSTGDLKYYNTNTGTPNPPNPKSIAIGSYVLWNIVSDYIQPFVTKNYS